MIEDVKFRLETVVHIANANKPSDKRNNNAPWRTTGRGGAAVQAQLVGPLQLFVDTIKQARKYLTAVAVARSVSIFAMYPMDTIKTRIQIAHPQPLRWQGLYGGVGGSLVGQVPYGVLTFGSYEMYKSALLSKNVPKVWSYALAAILGDLTGSVWLCPSEVVKQQLQAGMYDNTRQAFFNIWKTRGLQGLYQGYWGGVARDVPFRVAQLTSYEVAKNIYLRVKAKRRRYSDKNEPLVLSPAESAMVGVIAGSFSAAVTTPLDRIRTLLMTSSAGGSTSVWSCAAGIVEQEGLAGLATGLVPRVAYIAPSVALFFVAYEAVQQKLRHWS